MEGSGVIQSGVERLGRMARPGSTITFYVPSAGPAKTSDVLSGLQGLLGVGGVSTSTAIRCEHATDESYHKHGVPDIVVFPQTVGEVSSIVKLCSSFEMPIIPFGTGTGLEGGVSAPSGGVSIDMRGLKIIRAVNREDFDCTVEAGVTRKTLNEYLHDTGLWFPIDPGADASIGGMCATSASGTNAVCFGTMKDNVMNLQVVLPSGEVIWTRGEGRRPKKSSAGYNLTNLFVGSEGTLGVITAATLKLHGMPEFVSAAVCSFKKPRKAIDSVVEILQTGTRVARIEYMDELQIKACNQFSKLNYPVQPTLFMEFHGSTSDVTEQAQMIADICQGNSGSEFRWSCEPEARKKLWEARHKAYYAALALRPGTKGFILDACVPMSALCDAINTTQAVVMSSSLTGTIFGHVGEGNFHVVLLVDPSDAEQLKEAERISSCVVRIALQNGGTCTGEHGVGVGKKRYLYEELGFGTVALMKSIKRTIDPKNIMNPGKVLDVPHA